MTHSGQGGPAIGVRGRGLPWWQLPGYYVWARALMGGVKVCVIVESDEWVR